MSAVAGPGLRSIGFFTWVRNGARAVLGDARRHRTVFAIFGAIWALALIRVFIHPVPVIPVLFNWTPSLPYRILLVDPGPAALVRGDLIVYAFEGEAAQADYPGLKRQAFFKRIVGVAGDVVSVEGRDVFVNGQHVGRAKTHTFDRHPLDPIAATVLPPGQVYVQGSSADSRSMRLWRSLAPHTNHRNCGSRRSPKHTCK